MNPDRWPTLAFMVGLVCMGTFFGILVYTLLVLAN